MIIYYTKRIKRIKDDWKAYAVFDSEKFGELCEINIEDIEDSRPILIGWIIFMIIDKCMETENGRNYIEKYGKEILFKNLNNSFKIS